MRSWRLWVGVVAVFVCGVIAGAVGGNMYARYEAVRRIHEIRESGGQMLAQMTLRRLSDKLDLSERQQKQIEPLLNEAFARGHEVMEKARPQIDQIMRETMARIKKILDPAQLAELGPQEHLLLLPPPPPPPGGPGEGPWGPGGPGPKHD